MKPLLALLLVALLGLGATACGGTGEAANSGAQPVVKRDRDNDLDHGDDDGKFLNYGHAAYAAEARALTALVKRYYAAAAASDGTEACSMLYPFIAESVVEDYGHTPALRGDACATVMSKLFAQQHKLLAGKSATLKMYAIRVDGARALTVLSFAVLPEVRIITERREGNTWKVLNLLDSIIE
jgi:hypothetical protein